MNDVTASRAPETRMISSRAIGDLAVSPEAIMHFPVPLGGFPDEPEFVLLRAHRDGLWLLQSTREAGLTFVLGDPFMLDSSYAIDLSPTDNATLELTSPEHALTLVMLVLSPTGSAECTANFRAPLVFNVRRGRGLQVMNREDRHHMQRRVSLDAYPLPASQS